jgi:hypothetical protein
MAGPKSESSKQPRHLYKAAKAAGASKREAADIARASISKRSFPPSERPNAEQTREKGG